MLSGVRLFVPLRKRQHQKAFGDHRCDADPRDEAGVVVTRIAWHPLGLVLHVRAVQGFQLPPSGEEHQQTAPQAGDRTGAELGALLERRAEHREVQRDPGHPDALGLHAQLADHQFDCAVGRSGRAAHQVQGCSVVAPRDQGQHRHHFVFSRCVLDSLDEQAVAVGRVAEPAQRHREAALALGVPPGLGPRDHLSHLLAVDVAVAADTHRGGLPAAHGSRPGAPRAYRVRTTGSCRDTGSLRRRVAAR